MNYSKSEILDKIVFNDQRNDQTNNCARPIKVQERILDHIIDKVKIRDVHIIDIGCGIGNTVIAMKNRGVDIHTVHLIDKNKHCIDMASCSLLSFGIKTFEYNTNASVQLCSEIVKLTGSNWVIVLMMHDIAMSWSKPDLVSLINDIFFKMPTSNVIFLLEQLSIKDCKFLHSYDSKRCVTIDGGSFFEQSALRLESLDSLVENYALVDKSGEVLYRNQAILTEHDIVSILHSQKDNLRVQSLKLADKFGFDSVDAIRELFLIERNNSIN